MHNHLDKNKTRRVLIFSLVYYPRFIGGAEVAIKEITDRIDSQDIEFHMITLRLDKSLPKEEVVGNIRVFRVGFAGKCEDSSDSLRFPLHLNKYLLTFLGFWRAKTLHKKFQYDAIWSMMASYNGFSAMFFKKSFPEVPFILSLQEGDPIDYIKKRVGIFQPLFKKIFTSANLIQTISHYLTDYARSMGYKGEVEVVPNGVDVNKFIVDNKSFGKKDIGFDESDTVLITTSRLVVKNAVGDIISALKFLPESVKFVILGQGYQESELKQQVKKLNLEDRVKFLGYINHDDMPKYLHASDIFVRPSLSEGFGNSFIEAMAAGLPVIATPVGGIVDFLEHEKTGLFCEVQNPESIAKQVQRLNEPLRKRIVANALNMVQERYEWDLIAREMQGKVFNNI